MLNLKVVIQKIEVDQRVTLFQNFNVDTPWTFEPYHDRRPDDAHPEIFPFVFNRRVRFQTGSAGRETQVSLRENKDLWFADDYGVPEGMLIGILFPQNYVPEVFKFKEKAHIPVAAPAAAVMPPGHIDVHFNRTSRHAAITFHTTQTTYFGFKCIARHYSDAFPYPHGYAFLDEVIGTIGQNAGQIIVTREDLQQFKPLFKASADLDQLAQRMNELIALCQSQHPNHSELGSARSALGASLDTAIGTAGSLTTILYSYNNAGIVSTVISKLLAFFVL
jgi:hypothetical protein